MLSFDYAGVRWTMSLARMIVAGASGRAPRLPPGRLATLSTPRFADEHFYLRKAERYGPIFKVLWARNLTLCVVGIERGRRLLAEHQASMRALTVEIGSFVPKGFMRQMSGTDHSTYRAMFVAAMPQELVDDWEPELRHIVSERLASLAGIDAGDVTPGDRLVHAVDLISTRWLLVLFFGLPPSDPRLADLEAKFHRLGPQRFVHQLGPAQHAAFADLRTAVWALVRSHDDTSGVPRRDSVLTRLIARNRPQIDETVVGNIIYMIEMGRYDVRGLLRWILKHLADHADTSEALRNRRIEGPAGQLAEACVTETLRLEQAESLNRTVTEEFVFEGFRFPAGSAVRILLRESHRDPLAFADPEAYDPGRFAESRPGTSTYAPFGIGAHRCIAAQLVTRLSTLFVEQLSSGFTWSVQGDGPRHRGPHHWEPSPAFGIRVEPRKEPQQA